MKTILSALTLGLVLSTASAATDASPYHEEWPQWRGPERDGIHRGAHWPTGLEEDKLQLTWRKELGPGYSSPVLTKTRVFTVETRDKRDEVVRAFDRRSGKELWATDWEGAMSVPFFARANGSWARCTPTVDEGRLYVGGMRDLLACLDAETGKLLWKVDFVERNQTPLPSFGFVSSPMVHGDHVYVQAGGGFMKLDKRTGGTKWKTLDDGGGMYGSAFSSPVVENLGGRTLALVQTRSNLAGVDLETGREIWKHPVKAFRGMNILTPIVHRGGLFTSAYGGRTSMFRPVAAGNGTELELAWDNKLQGYMSTPVVIEGHAYLHLRNTRFACVNLDSGEIAWTSSKKFGKYMSLVAQGNRILALDERGILFLIQADTKDLEILSERKVSDQDTWAHVAVADSQVFVRELNALSVFDWTDNR